MLHGVMKQFSICIAVESRHGPEMPTRTIAAVTEWCTYSPQPTPHAFSFALLEGAGSAGLQRFPNANGRMMEVAGWMRVRR